jgi:hypothetical protein
MVNSAIEPEAADLRQRSSRAGFAPLVPTRLARPSFVAFGGAVAIDPSAGRRDRQPFVGFVNPSRWTRQR